MEWFLKESKKYICKTHIRWSPSQQKVGGKDIVVLLSLQRVFDLRPVITHAGQYLYPFQVGQVDFRFRIRLQFIFFVTHVHPFIFHDGLKSNKYKYVVETRKKKFDTPFYISFKQAILKGEKAVHRREIITSRDARFVGFSTRNFLRRFSQSVDM